MQDPNEQPATDERYQLFQYASCPFCHRVRHFLTQAGIDIPMRDILTERAAFDELMQGGGSQMVPCLRIERTGVLHSSDSVEWLYESLDIMKYLAAKFDIA